METTLLYEDVLDSLADPIYIVDSNGDFMFVNQSLIDITGYTRSELMQFNTFKLCKDGIIDSCLTSQVISAKERKSAIQHIVKKDKVVKKLLVVSTPIFDNNGNVKNMIGHLRDIDRINEINKITIEENRISILRHKNVDAAKRASENIIFKSRKMKDLLYTSQNIAYVDAAVMIQGESGTGKEVIANYIHSMSPRKGKEMVKINCASLPESLLEAELFGYVKGSFTGASDSGKQGLIELADGGTLFLDEIDSLPLTTQGKLLRILETKMLQRIGSVKAKYIDFRLITATNANLQLLMDENKFRKDLFFRLNVIPINIPPLRERKEDIWPLTLYFIDHYSKKYGKSRSFSENIHNKLLKYDWPGNVRELKNFIERTIVMSSHSVTEIEDVPSITFGSLISNEIPFSVNDEYNNDIDCKEETVNSNNFSMKNIDGMSLKEAVGKFEDFLIERTYNEHKSTYKTAQALGVNQSTIVRKKNRLKNE